MSIWWKTWWEHDEVEFEGHEMEGESDEWVDGKGHDEVEVEGNEVEDKINWQNLTTIRTYLNKTQTIIIKTVCLMETMSTCTPWHYQFKRRHGKWPN